MSLRPKLLAAPLSLIAACALPGAVARGEGNDALVRVRHATHLKARAADPRDLVPSEICALPEGALLTLEGVEGDWNGPVRARLVRVSAPDGTVIACALDEVHAFGPAFEIRAGDDAGATVDDDGSDRQGGEPIPPLTAPTGAVVLEATMASVVKASPVDSRSLPPERKCDSPVGSRFSVTGVTRQGNGHLVATSIASSVDRGGADLGCGLAPAYFFAGHFRQVSGPAIPGSGGGAGPYGLAWPTRGRGIRSDSGGDGKFGAPRGGGTRSHEGLDILAAEGESIFAAGDGSLITAGWAGGYGNLMEIAHANARTTRYGHLSGFVVRSRGAWVGQGDRIALAGRTGNASGPEIRTHLHFEVRENGVPVNPLRRLP